MDNNDLVNTELNDEVTDVVTDDNASPTDTAQVAAPHKVKSAAGRKVDHTGKTALGAARLLYAANPTLTTKELRALFVKELGPKFNTSEAVAQTYVSLVRKPKKVA